MTLEKNTCYAPGRNQASFVECPLPFISTGVTFPLRLIALLFLFNVPPTLRVLSMRLPRTRSSRTKSPRLLKTGRATHNSCACTWTPIHIPSSSFFKSPRRTPKSIKSGNLERNCERTWVCVVCPGAPCVTFVERTEGSIRVGWS